MNVGVCKMSPHYLGKYTFADGETIMLEEFKEWKALASAFLSGKSDCKKELADCFAVIKLMPPKEGYAWAQTITGIFGIACGEIPSPFLSPRENAERRNAKQKRIKRRKK